MYGNLPYILVMTTIARHFPATASESARPKARLEARIPGDLKDILELASTLTGHSSLTGYIIQALTESASRTVNEHRSVRLSIAESDAFVKSLLEPAAPTPALQNAFARYREQVR